jgi:hypothetical protein
MPLLFLLADASTHFALRERTGLQYASERFRRLGVLRVRSPSALLR